MSDLNDRLEEAGMPVRLYGNPATMFKKTVKEYKHIKKIREIKGDKVAEAKFEEVKAEFTKLDDEYKRDFEDWASRNPQLAAEYAASEAALKAKRNKTNENEEEEQKPDSVPSKAKVEEKKTSEAQVKRSKKRNTNDEEKAKTKKRKSDECESEEEETHTPHVNYRNSFLQLAECADGNEMKQMVKIVTAFKNESNRINKTMTALFAEIEKLKFKQKENQALLSRYNELVETLMDKIDKSCHSVLQRQANRNQLKS